MSEASPSAILPREELVTLVARAHLGAPYAECKVAGAALADQSQLPRRFAENLGAGFGQWTFFPEPHEFVEFACAYVSPQTADDVWALARAWAADDAASRHTVLALVGRELLQLELQRIAVPELAALFAERGARALEKRRALGLDMPPARERATAAAAPKRSPPEAAPNGDAPPPAVRAAAPAAAAAKSAPVEGPLKMPKPTLTRVKPPPPPPPRHFTHPKFGAGVLERVDGAGDDAKLTIRFESGTKTLLARFVTEVAG